MDERVVSPSSPHGKSSAVMASWMCGRLIHLHTVHTHSLTHSHKIPRMQWGMTSKEGNSLAQSRVLQGVFALHYSCV